MLFTKKIFRLNIFIVSLFICIIALICVFWVGREIDRNITTTSDSLLKMASNNVEYFLTDTKDTTDLIVTSTAVQQGLTESMNSDLKYADTVAYRYDILYLLNTLTNNKSHIGMVNLSNDYMQIRSFKSYTFSSVSGLDEILSNQELLRISAEANGSGCWTNGMEVGNATGNILVYSKMIRNLNTLSNIGIIVMGIDKSALDKILSSLSNNMPIGLVITHKGQILYNQTNYISGAEGFLAEQTALLDREGFATTALGDKVYITHNSIPEVDLGISMITYCNAFETQKRNIIASMVAIAAGMIAIALAGLHINIRRLTAQLGGLRDYIYAIHYGNQIDEVFFPGKDEISMIGNEFVKIVKDNQALTKKLYSAKYREKEAELLVLQSQVNPHFLYNALDSIFWMAKIQKMENISNITVALSNMFRLTLNKGDKEITLENELSLIENYLRIQNTRYNNKFDVHIDVPANLRQNKIIKFLLQPIVENSLYHGLEPLEERGRIDISACRDGHYLDFTIRDNGVGFDSDDPAYIEGGYAIQNIRKRVEIYYGEGCGLTIHSRPDEGCTAKLRIHTQIKAADDLGED